MCLACSGVAIYKVGKSCSDLTAASPLDGASVSPKSNPQASATGALQRPHRGVSSHRFEMVARINQGRHRRETCDRCGVAFEEGLTWPGLGLPVVLCLE